MKIVKDKIGISELRQIGQIGFFVNLVKVVVDIKKKIISIDAETHAELMNFLIEKENSESKNLWGINLIPDKEDEEFIMFDSLINLKPGLGNRTRGVENTEIRKKIINIINSMVKK